MQAFCLRVTEDPRFQAAILAFIVLAGVLAGIETYPAAVQRAGGALDLLNQVILGVFCLEIALKIGAVGGSPARFARDGWNVFDFLIVGASFLPLGTASLPVLRLLRLLRFLRLLRALPRLQVLVGALIHSIPSMGYVALLLAMLFYVYGILGVSLWGANDPFHFLDLPTAMLTLFGCATGEGWVDVMYIEMYGCDRLGYDGMEALCTSPQARPVLGAIYFVSFMMVGAMVTLNLLVGVIMNGMEQTAAENAAMDAAAAGDTRTVATELSALEQDIEQLRERLASLRSLTGP